MNRGIEGFIYYVEYNKFYFGFNFCKVKEFLFFAFCFLKIVIFLNSESSNVLWQKINYGNEN